LLTTLALPATLALVNNSCCLLGQQCQCFLLVSACTVAQAMNMHMMWESLP